MSKVDLPMPPKPACRYCASTDDVVLFVLARGTKRHPISYGWRCRDQKPCERRVGKPPLRGTIHPGMSS